MSNPVVKPSLAHKIEIWGDAVHAGQVGHCVIAIQIARLKHTQTQADIVFCTPQRIHAIKGVKPHGITRFGKHAKRGDIANGHRMVFP